MLGRFLRFCASAPFISLVRSYCITMIPWTLLNPFLNLSQMKLLISGRYKSLCKNFTTFLILFP